MAVNPKAVCQIDHFWVEARRCYEKAPHLVLTGQLLSSPPTPRFARSSIAVEHHLGAFRRSAVAPITDREAEMGDAVPFTRLCPVSGSSQTRGRLAKGTTAVTSERISATIERTRPRSIAHGSDASTAARTSAIREPFSRRRHTLVRRTPSSTRRPRRAPLRPWSGTPASHLVLARDAHALHAFEAPH
jgi:hypothetical protein